jgi:hypothetical protein
MLRTTVLLRVGARDQIRTGDVDGLLLLKSPSPYSLLADRSQLPLTLATYSDR